MQWIGFLYDNVHLTHISSTLKSPRFISDAVFLRARAGHTHCHAPCPAPACGKRHSTQGKRALPIAHYTFLRMLMSEQTLPIGATFPIIAPTKAERGGEALLSSWAIFDFCIPSALLTLIIFLHTPVSSAKTLKCRTRSHQNSGATVKTDRCPIPIQGNAPYASYFDGPLRIHSKLAKRYLLTNDCSLLTFQVLFY